MNTAVVQKISERAVAQIEQPEFAQLPDGYGGQNQSLAISLARAEVDQQIATARALPRSIEKAVRNITSLATLDAESAKECIYALPRGGTPIKGPSIRLAEIIHSQWGNCRVGARVVHVDRIEKYVEAEGIFHDLETNAASTARVRRSISDKNGKIYKDDMILVTGNAVCSIAKRNAILGAVPKAVWRAAYAAVEKVLAGDVKTLVVRRAEAMKAFAAFGVKPEQIFLALKVKGMEELSADHIITLIGMHSALKSGEETVETMFAKNAEDAPTRPKPEDFVKTEKDKAGEALQEKGDGNADLSSSAPEGGTQHQAAGATPTPVQEAADAGLKHAQDGEPFRTMPAKYRSNGETAKAFEDAYYSFKADGAE